VLTVAAFQPTTGRAESPQEAFAGGKALLAKADFQGALQAFAKAARGDRQNQEYLQHYAMVRQVIALRKQLETEQDAGRWEYVARALHAFYASQGLYDESLALNQRVHAKLKSAHSALTLAETQLALNQCGDAAETLSAVDASKHTTATRALLGLALARDGKMDQARKIAEAVQLPADVGPGTVYAVARLHAAMGGKNEALGLLARCFASVAPSVQAGFKNHAKQSPEFAAWASTAEFASVLATPSKAPESKCSGGTSCAGCPMRGQCAHSQGR
jgi:Flp pilus assembly protein TadD